MKNKFINPLWGRFAFKLLVVSFFIMSQIQFVNAQKNSWHLFQSNASCKNLQFSNSSMTFGSNYPKPPNNPRTNLPFDSFYSSNVCNDINGALLFYVICDGVNIYLFDRKNTLVQSWPGISREIGIVPIDQGVNYHIIAAGKIYAYHIGNKKEIECVNPYLGHQVLYLGHYEEYSNYDFVLALKYYRSNDGCITGYKCYSLAGNKNGTTKRELLVTTYTKKTNEFTHTSTDITTFSNKYTYYISEMELSNDGSKLCFASDDKIFIFDVNTNTGELSNSAPSYTYSYNNTSEPYRIGGIEFVNNSTIVYSIFDSYNLSNSSVDAIYRLNITNSVKTKISNSEEFSRSAIEYSKNGKFIVLSGTKLAEIDLNSNSMNVLYSNQTFELNMNLYMYYYVNPSTAYFEIYNLPDQMDGETIEYLDLTETVFDYIFPSALSGTISYSNSSHNLTPKGYGKVFVVNSLNIKNTSSPVVLDGMVIDFFDDAEFNVYPGSSLTLKGTYLKSADCEKMWTGIRIFEGSSYLKNYSSYVTLQKNAAGQNSRIKDAYTGISMKGPKNNLTIKEETNISSCEICVQIVSNTKSRVSIKNSYFIGDLALKHSNYGVKNGYTDNLTHGLTGIQLMNADVVIGETASQNHFVGGQNGIIALGSNLEIIGNEFKNHKQYGVVFDAQKNAGKSFIVTQNSIHDLQQGLRILGETQNSTIQSNNFTNNLGYAIQYIGNHGGSLLIGDQNNSSLGNTFNNCNWSAIECFDNYKFSNITQISGTGTSIRILNNTIDNQLYASGVSVGEAFIATRTFLSLQIRNNNIGTISKVGQGIVMRQITGANKLLPLINPSRNLASDGNFDINNNQIQFSNSINSGYKGILAERTSKINYYSNNIAVSSENDWRPIGIKISEGSNSLVSGNTIHAGCGLQVTGDGIYSNYLCNTFQNCVTGIQLGFNVLRIASNLSPTVHSNYQIHAHNINNSTSIYGRPNAFVNTASWGSDIDVYTTTIDRNQWDFVANNIPKITQLVIPNIPPKSIVHNKFRLDPCGSIANETSNDSSMGESQNFDIAIDSALDWKLKYGVVRNYLSGQGIQFINEPNISKLIKIENKMFNNEFVSAFQCLQGFSPNNQIENDFKTIYNIWLNHLLNPQFDTVGKNEIFHSDTVHMGSSYYIDSCMVDSFSLLNQYVKLTTTEIDQLIIIAQKDGIRTSPAAYAARAILWSLYQMQFDDSSIVFYPHVFGSISSSCYSANVSNIEVDLYDENNQFTGLKTYTDSMGKFVFHGTQFKNLDTSLMYYFTFDFSPDSSFQTPKYELNHFLFDNQNDFNCNSSNQMILKSNEMNRMNEIIVTPNPTAGNLRFYNLPKKCLIEITSINGKQLYSNSGTNISELNILNSFDSGLYLINITDLISNEKTTKKVILQK